MKVIFLDIDGVLNYTDWYVSDRNPGNINGQEGEIDPMCVERVVRICQETGAKIVISSDWRVSWPGAKIRLENAGFPRGLIIDKTPDCITRMLSFRDYMLDDDDDTVYNNSRGYEVDLWLKEHPECTNYTIIDDRRDFTDEQEPHQVKVDSKVGLTDDDVDIAIMILNHH